MKRTYTIILTFCVVALLATTQAFAQENGDYRATTQGNWSDTDIWETYNGSWAAAATAPDGSENITITTDTVFVDSNINITGHVTVADSGVVSVSDGSTLTFEDGSTYEHARDGGSIPEADWGDGSTTAFTGIVESGPDDRDQAYSTIYWDNPNQTSNISLGLGTVILTGDVHVVDTGTDRLHLTDSGSGDGETITINGDVIVEGGQLTTTGSGSTATYGVIVEGDVIVHEGANLAPSRGSGGYAVWEVHGDFTVVGGATLQNSNDDNRGGFAFVRDTTGGNAPQIVNISSDVSYNGGVNFFVPDTLNAIEVEADGEFFVEDTLRNSGTIVTNDSSIVIVGDGGVYEHARDGGEIPTATWEEGSTALFTGITENAPDNRGQDYYNLVLNTPNSDGNKDLSLHGNTVYGDIEVINTGSDRWYLTSPSGDAEVTREVTVMGDIMMESGQFSSNGSGNDGDIIVHHYGDIVVNDGNFSISRGSGPVVSWYMYEGDIIFNGGESQSSNARGGNAFIFAGADSVTQHLTLSEDFEMNALPVVVDTGAVLDIGTSDFSESGENFEVRSGATLAVADTAGLGENLSLGGSGETVLTLSSEAHYIYNGTEAQVTGNSLPLTVASLTIDNEAGVELSRTLTINEYLRLVSGELDNTVPFELGDNGEVIVEGGSLLHPGDFVSNELTDGKPVKFSLEQNYPNPFNPTTKIQYAVPEQANVSIKVYDITGREVAELVNSRHTAGVYTQEWNASNFASGIYIYRIQAGDFTAVRKLTLIK